MNAPGEHDVHSLAPSVALTVPRAHLVHATAPARWSERKVPATHRWHSANPVAAVNVPGVHDVHSLAPCEALILPSAHFAHVKTSPGVRCERNVPAVQLARSSFCTLMHVSFALKQRENDIANTSG